MCIHSCDNHPQVWSTGLSERQHHSAAWPPVVRMLRRLFTFLISIEIALLAVSLLGLSDFISGSSAFTVMILIVALVVSSLVRWALSSKPLRSSALPIGIKTPPATSSSLLSNRYEIGFSNQFAEGEADQIISSLLGDSNALRISEDVSIENTTYVRTLRIVAQRPEDHPPNDRWVQVVAWTIKGSPLANFKLEVVGTPETRTLTFPETSGALLYYADALLEIAFPSQTPSDFEIALKKMITNHGRATDKEIGELRHKWIESIKTAADEKSDRTALEKLSELVYNAGRTYPVFALLPASVNLARIRIDYRSPVQNIRPQASINTPANRVHALLSSTIGLAQRSHQIRLSHARLAPSYHLNFNAPDGLYLYEADAVLAPIGKQASTSLSATEMTEVDPSFACSSKRGGDSVAVYGRDLDKIQATTAGAGGWTPMFHPMLALEMRERPPGAIAVLTGVSVLLALMITVASIWHNYVFGLSEIPKICLDGRVGLSDNLSCKPKPLSTWPAALFTIPAIISGWLASRASRESISKLSISTVAIFVWLSANTLTAAALVAIKMTFPFSMQFDFELFQTKQFAWTCLLISSISCATICLLLSIFKSSRYRQRTTPRGA